MEPDRPGATPSRTWTQVTLRAYPEDVDLVAELLHPLAPDGVAIHPAVRIDDGADFAYEELDAPSAVVAALPHPLPPSLRETLAARLAALPLSRPVPPPEFETVSERDWAEEWKRFYTLQRIGRRVVVHPSWEPYEGRPGEAVIALDPGTAFGTGQHETTRLCLAALDHVIAPGARVLDVGTGSGVLAIAAVRLGAAGVRAIDIDAAAVAVARDNAAANAVGDRVACEAGALEPDGMRPPVDVVVANISSVTVIALLPAIRASLAPRGLAVLSGFIARDAEAVERAAVAAGLTPVDRSAEGDWRCLVARRER